MYSPLGVAILATVVSIILLNRNGGYKYFLLCGRRTYKLVGCQLWSLCYVWVQLFGDDKETGGDTSFRLCCIYLFDIILVCMSL